MFGPAASEMLSFRSLAPRRILRLILLPALCLLAHPGDAQTPNEAAREAFKQAVSDFEQGKIQESVTGFNRVAELLPDSMPQLWQRGIALYYAGQYGACREQFEEHRKVNPNDVENSVWHFLCVARAESPEKARAALLPVGLDPRLPMVEIYQMFRGGMAPERVLTAAGGNVTAQFFAHLYIGLYNEALNNTKDALQHIRLAADDRYASGGYMHMVAKVHLALLQTKK